MADQELVVSVRTLLFRRGSKRSRWSHKKLAMEKFSRQIFALDHRPHLTQEKSVQIVLKTSAQGNIHPIPQRIEHHVTLASGMKDAMILADKNAIIGAAVRVRDAALPVHAAVA